MIRRARYGTSQWMEGAAHYTASQVGLILLPLSAISIIVARLVSGRGWVRWPLILTGASFVLTGAVMVFTTHSSNVLVLLGMSLLFGFANGFSGFANQAALYVQSPAGEIAVASGLYRTFAYVIGGIGVTVLLMTILDRKIPARTDT